MFLYSRSSLGKIPAIVTKNNINDKIESEIVLPIHGLYFISFLFIVLSSPISSFFCLSPITIKIFLNHFALYSVYHTFTSRTTPTAPNRVRQNLLVFQRLKNKSIQRKASRPEGKLAKVFYFSSVEYLRIMGIPACSNIASNSSRVPSINKFF